MRCRDGEFTMHCNLKIIAVLAILAVALTGAVAIVDSNSDADAASDVYYVVGDTTYTEQTSSALMTIEAIGATVPAGKTFVGWSLEGAITNVAPIAGNTYTAMFEIATYDVVFSANGEYVPFSNVTYGNDVFPSADVADKETYLDYSAVEGYEFIGWSDGITTYASDEIPAVTCDVTYTAVFSAIVVEPTTYTVTFMVGEEVYLTETVSAGDMAIEPYILGYTWDFDFDTAITANTSINAIAIVGPAEYTVTYMVGDEVYQTDVVADGALALDLAIDGYTWDFDFDTVISENTTINAVPIAEPSNEIFGMTYTMWAIILIVIAFIVVALVIYGKNNGLFGEVKK